MSEVKIWLNGVQFKDVVVADEEKRFALTVRRDNNGNIVTKDDKLVYDEFFGHVRIEVPVHFLSCS